MSRIFSSREEQLKAAERVRRAAQMRLDADRMEQEATEVQNPPVRVQSQDAPASHPQVEMRTVPANPPDVSYMTHDANGKPIPEELQKYYPIDPANTSAFERWWNRLHKGYKAIIFLTPTLVADRIASAHTGGQSGVFEQVWRFVLIQFGG